MSEIWTPALAGGVAGLGVAMPLGAIGVLLLREGWENGFRVAAAAAVGVALVDLVYCALATVLGVRVSATVEHHRGAFLLLSGLVIVGIGGRQLIAAWRAGGATPAGPVGRTTSAWRAFARFVVLTAVNPITLVYFVALAGAVTTSNNSRLAPAVFVTAVGLSSLAWQLLLAGVGSVSGASISARASRVVGVVASGVVVSLGAAVLASGTVALT
ncbi:MAG TPA: LysE family transporter [Nocardioides sp.]|uniref:LysE family transporter n=1 Tax=Nocardioides sp. TaxID=35761 RepID=UPI002C2F12A3|nr:LysE family transporter [Nocardioides sp.]HTW18341.1 LysE family transporter [Nocardioides sp.]